MEKGNIQIRPHSGHPVPSEGQGTGVSCRETFVKFTVHTPYHHITKDLFTQFLLPSTCVWLSRKNWQKTQSKGTGQVSEPVMAGMLEWPDQEFKATVTNMLSTLIDKVDDMQEQMGSVSGEIEILRKNATPAKKKKKVNLRSYYTSKCEDPSEIKLL